MADDSGGEKTEQATGKKREEARDQGQVAKSQEVSGAILLIVGMVILLGSSSHFVRVLGGNASYLFSQSHILKPDNADGMREMFAANLTVLVTALAPLMLGVLVAGIGANIMQVGLNFSSKSLEFKADKLNPASGLKKYFQKDMYIDILKNVFKVTIIGILAVSAIKKMFWEINSSSLLELSGIVALGKISFIKLMSQLLAFTVFLAIVDWFWTKYRHEEQIKMSKHDVKQENKDMEGDPQIKARIKAQQFEMSRKRMLTDVPSADVVVTNPTHFAVALKYIPGSPAPMVVAKGQDHIAQIIKKTARKARVPIIENKPLARSLYRQCEVGQQIPDSLFQAVAEVLAYIFRLKKG